jgi:NADH-quinone oxidoreductase subunit K
MVPVDHVIALSAILFAIGLVGVVTRRNLIVILMSIQVMLNAAALAFVAFNRMWPQGSEGIGESALDGQILVLIVISVAAAQIAVGLGILISMFRNRDSVNVDDVSLLRW